MTSVAATATLSSSSRVSSSADRRSEPREICITPDKLACSISQLYGTPITTKTLANWRSAGKGPAFIKIGRRVAYNITAVNQWFQAQRRNRGDE